MGAAEWWAIGVSSVSLAISAVTLWQSWRWRRAERLLGLHEKLRQLKAAALKHLDVQAGEYPTESDVTDLREQAAVVARRAPWSDVREAAERLFEECNAVMAPRVREAQIERQDEIRSAIQHAFDVASAAIGEQWGRVRP